jgi:hypothetical protein
MTRLRGVLTATAAVPLILLGACATTDAAGVGAGASASTGSGGAAESGTVTYGADQLVLRAENYGGFVPADRVLGRIPDISVYGDGRVITQGPMPSIYPQPAMPNVQVQTISPDTVRDLVRQALAAGVRNGADFGRPHIADASTTRVTVVSGGNAGGYTGGDKQVVAVDGLSQAQSDDPALTTAQRQARAKLAAFVKKLNQLPGSQGMPSAVKYQPERLAVLSQTWVKQADVQSAQKAWSGPALPGAYLYPATKVGCVVLTGAQRDAAVKAASDASKITGWTSGGGTYQLTFRPMLPDERDCSALKTGR